MTAQQRGEWAKNLLANPLFEEAFKFGKDFFTDQMVATSPQDQQTRDHLHLRIIALKDVKQFLTAFVMKGNLEKRRTLSEEKLKNVQHADADKNYTAKSRSRRAPRSTSST